MGRYLIWTAVVVTVLGAATGAVAMSRRGFEQGFGTTKAGRPSGMSLTVTWFGGSRARRDSSVDDVLPRGARLDTSARPRCKASGAQIASSGGSVCAAGSRVGSGHAKLRLAAKGSPDIDTRITVFNARRALILYLEPAGANVQVLRAKLRGRRLHLQLPVLCGPTGTKPKCGPGGNVRIVRLDLAIERLRGYLTTPKRCPRSKRWTFKLRFHGRDGRTRSRTSRMSCRS